MLERYIREVGQHIVGGRFEDMLRTALEGCMTLSGARGGSILTAESTELVTAHADASTLIGVRVSPSSSAGDAFRENVVIYEYAAWDERELANDSGSASVTTRFLLTVRRSFTAGRCTRS
jgi:hypothetical protein